MKSGIYIRWECDCEDFCDESPLPENHWHHLHGPRRHAEPMGSRAAVERRGSAADVGPAVHPVRVDDARRGSGGRGVAHRGTSSVDGIWVGPGAPTGAGEHIREVIIPFPLGGGIAMTQYNWTILRIGCGWTECQRMKSTAPAGDQQGRSIGGHVLCTQRREHWGQEHWGQARLSRRFVRQRDIESTP